MSSLGLDDRRIALSGILRQLTLPIFALTIFTSALLLFAVEPMFTKMALPALGGSPSVWSVAMVFFQGVMFAGYCYAHALTRWMKPRYGAILHAGVLVCGFLTLPVALRTGIAPPSDGAPAIWLLGIFSLSVGLPFFALSAHGPLLQAWFSRSGHAQARDPYFLYGASNIGSFAALIAYPLVIEPLSGLAGQSHAWSIGFVALVAMMVMCAVSVFGPGSLTNDSEDHIQVSAGVARTSYTRMLSWVAFAFVPSALLISVTAHISTDIAAAPLLWVIPLGLYLLTFVLAFRSPPSLSGLTLGPVQSWLSAAVLMAGCIGMFSPLMIGLAVHLALFFINGTVCHAALYQRRPEARDLTLF